MSIENHKAELFRLAAVLYADNNYEVNLKTIHRKIIESILLEIDSTNISTHEVIDYAHTELGITIGEESLNDIINSNPDKFYRINQNGEVKVSLTPKRKVLLKDKIETNTIDYFISEFEKEYNDFNNVKETVYKFLYEVFSTNTESFQKLLDNKKTVTDLFNPSSTNYTEKEKEIVNAFLFWDNPDKNKAIFDISSYALEYCMLTNKDGGTVINLKELKNKYFYLDTNIIYRGLGINGENRKNRTKTFLNKFLEADEKLVISKVTDEEFKETIKNHLNKIQSFNNPRVRSELYTKHYVQNDIYNFYHTWRCTTINNSIEMFLAHILDLYAKFKKEFKIDFDTTVPYNIKETNVCQKRDSYVSEIYFHKNDDYTTQAEFDADNILWIEEKRNGNANNIFDTKYYFISTDLGLRSWDYQRQNLTPLVILPSQWMTILLRYFKCTSDDYKSFISFLNLKNNEKIIDGEKLHIVLAGIGEMTENIDYQRSILDILIENKFSDVIKKNSTKEQIFENTKQFAKTKLEETVEQQAMSIEEMQSSNAKLKEEVDTAKNNVNKISTNLNSIGEKLDEVTNIKNKLEQQTIEIKEKHNATVEKLQELYIETELKKWKRQAKFFIPIIIIAIIFFSLQIFFKNWEYNIVTKLIVWIDSNPSETVRDLLKYINVCILGGITTLGYLTYKRLCSKDAKDEKVQNIREKMPNEYK